MMKRSPTRGVEMPALLTEPLVEELSATEGQQMLRSLVGDRLQLSLETFYERLDNGEYDASDDDQILRLVMLAPFGR